MRLLILTLLVVLFRLPALADSPDIIKCQTFPAPLNGSFCIDIPTVNKSNDILYYMHPLNGSEQSFFRNPNWTQQLVQQYQIAGMARPTVVTMSFGPIWLLAEKNTSPYSGLFEAVAYQIIPMIEAQLGGLQGRRLLMGESMGGVNSFQLATKTSMFNKAVVICAPMADVTQFDTPDTIEKYLEGTTAWAYYSKTNNTQILKDNMSRMIQLSTQFFPTPDDWAKANPLVLADTTPTPTQLYMSVGMIDEYASYDTTVEVVTKLQKHGVPVEWHPMWGGHCVEDISSIYGFLTR